MQAKYFNWIGGDIVKTKTYLIKSEFRLFLKNKLALLLMGITWVALNAQVIKALNESWDMPYNGFVYVCNVTQNFSILMFLALQWITFFQFWQMRKSGVTQVGTGGVSGYYMLGLKTLPSVFVLVLLSANLIIYDIIWIMRTTAGNWPVFKHYILCWVINYFAQGILGIMMGAAVALSIKKVQSGVAVLLLSMLVFTPLLIPLLESFAYLQSKVLKIADCFATYPVVSIWTPNYPYGYGIERTRCAALLLWMIACLLAIYHAYSPGKKPAVRAKKAVMSLCCVGLLIYVLMPTGMLYKEGNIYRNLFDGYTYQDNMYYTMGIINGKITLKNDTAANFTVDSVDMDIKIGRTLLAAATIQYSGAQEKAYFTLSHYYKIKKIVDQDGNKLPFERETDYFSFEANGSGSATVYYSGSSTYYYSNDQAAFLPAYFAWYPMAGYHSLYNFTYGLARVDDTAACKYTMTVDAPYTIYTNLSGDKNTYTGYCKGPTLLAGIYDIQQTNHIELIGSPMTNPVDRKSAQEIEAQVEQLALQCGVTLPKHYKFTCFQAADCMYTVSKTYRDYQLFYSADETQAIAQRILLQLTVPQDNLYRRMLTQILDDGMYFLSYCNNAEGQTEYEQLCQAWRDIYTAEGFIYQSNTFKQSLAYVVQGNETGLLEYLTSGAKQTEGV